MLTFIMKGNSTFQLHSVKVKVYIFSSPRPSLQSWSAGTGHLLSGDKDSVPVQTLDSRGTCSPRTDGALSLDTSSGAQFWQQPCKVILGRNPHPPSTSNWVPHPPPLREAWSAGLPSEGILLGGSATIPSPWLLPPGPFPSSNPTLLPAVIPTGLRCAGGQAPSSRSLYPTALSSLGAALMALTAARLWVSTQVTKLERARPVSAAGEDPEETPQGCPLQPVHSSSGPGVLLTLSIPSGFKGVTPSPGSWRRGQECPATICTLRPISHLQGREVNKACLRPHGARDSQRNVEGGRFPASPDHHAEVHLKMASPPDRPPCRCTPEGGLPS